MLYGLLGIYTNYIYGLYIRVIYTGDKYRLIYVGTRWLGLGLARVWLGTGWAWLWLSWLGSIGSGWLALVVLAPGVQAPGD